MQSIYGATIHRTTKSPGTENNIKSFTLEMNDASASKSRKDQNGVNFNVNGAEGHIRSSQSPIQISYILDSSQVNHTASQIIDSAPLDYITNQKIKSTSSITTLFLPHLTHKSSNNSSHQNMYVYIMKIHKNVIKNNVKTLKHFNTTSHAESMNSKFCSKNFLQYHVSPLRGLKE